MGTKYSDLFETNAVEEIEATAKVPDLTLTLGDLTLRRWGPYVHICKGVDETGMEQVEVGGIAKILGVFSGLFEVVDNRDHFDTLTQVAHTYKFERQTHHAHAGYELVKGERNGLAVTYWRTVSYDPQLGYQLGRLIKPVDYSLTESWSEAAQEANRMAHAIVHKHNGINYALRALAGKTVIKFSVFSVKREKRDIVEGKISLFGQSKEAREASKESGKLRGELSRELRDVREYAAKRSDAGTPVQLTEAAKGMTVRVLTSVGEWEDWNPSEIAGKTFNPVINGIVTHRRSVNTVEEAARFIAWLRERTIPGGESYLDAILVDAAE